MNKEDKANVHIESITELENGGASVKLTITEKALEFIIDDFMNRSVEGLVKPNHDYWEGAESNDDN